jgi:hypothetical protein
VEPVQAPQLCGQSREVLIRLVVREHAVGPLHSVDRRHELPTSPLDHTQARQDAGGGVRLTLFLEQRHRLFQGRLGLFDAAAHPGHLAGALAHSCLLHGIVGKVGRLLEVPLRLLGGGQRRRALRSLGEQLDCPLLDLGRVGSIGGGLVPSHVMRRDDLDDLRVGGERLLEVLRSREMARAPLPLRERLVRNPLEQILQEPVLAPLG